MIWQVIKGFIPGGNLLGKGVAIVTILSTLSGGLLWLYSAVKAQGKAEAQLETVTASYASLERETGVAILRLNQQHARAVLAANKRQRDGEVIQASSTAAINQLQKELDDARKNGDTCLDIPLPPSRAQRVRDLAAGVGSLP